MRCLLSLTIGDFYSMSMTLFALPFAAHFRAERWWSRLGSSRRVDCAHPVVAIPFCVIIVFQLNQLLQELGATDLAGAVPGWR